MDEYINNLNEEQQQAVMATEGMVRVVAGAGSGKTRALSSRFAFLVNEIGILPGNILCVTFTNKAANEMRQRIHQLTGDNDTGYINTFHGFCVSVLQEDSHVVQYPKSFLVLDNSDIDTMLQTIYEERGLTLRDMTFSHARDMIEMLKLKERPRYYLDMIGMSLEELYQKYQYAETAKDIIFYGYLYQEKKCFGLDYNDLLKYTLYIFEQSEAAKQKWQKRLEYIMIDEFQDIDQPQYELMEVLCGYHGNLFIVGDPDQTIYSWRGASGRYLMEFARTHKDVRTIMMMRNYRSTPQILQAVNSLISRNRDRIAKDLKWKTATEYGELDITINLSKPEKDPKAIAAARNLPASAYPVCQLCKENEGYAGRINHPARQNHRVIPITIHDSPWFLQYSPYVYYNEHCICFNSVHTPMKIDRACFEKLLDFVSQFPHYFVGSNADLPIVGGSILAHDHFQGGRYVFPMERAGIETPFAFPGYDDVAAGIVKWPMAVIRLQSGDRERLAQLAEKILTAWRGYTDEAAMILAETEGVPHNTITPIARMRNGKYELDLVLRNNLTTPEHPLGLYHPHAELHHIKKENIGLIEVMGLAVLPARLKEELHAVADALVSGADLRQDERTAKHAPWAEGFRNRYSFTPDNAFAIVQQETGLVFARVLEHAGVYARNPAGREAFLRFLRSV